MVLKSKRLKSQDQQNIFVFSSVEVKAAENYSTAANVMFSFWQR